MNPRLYATFLSNDPTKRILVCSSADGTTWNGGEFVGEYTKATASQVFFKGKYWGAFVGKDSNNVLISSSDDAVHWSRNRETGQSTKGAPSLTVFKDRLWLAFLANDKETASKVWIISSADGIQWTRAGELNRTSLYAPSITAFKGRLWAAFVEKKSNAGTLAFASSEDGAKWSEPVGTPESTDQPPSLTVFFDQLCCAVTEAPSRVLVVATSPEGRFWTFRGAGLAQRSKAAPFLAVFDSRLHMSFIEEQSDNQILVASSADAIKWSAATRVNQTSPVAVSLYSRYLYVGTVRPKYQIVTLVYAPPGTNGGKGASEVVYGSGSTLGTVTSTSSSFKAGVKVSASVDFSGVGASSDFGYSTTDTETSSVDVQKSKSFMLKVPGPSEDGIDHDADTFYLWLNPQFKVTVDSLNNFNSGLEIDGDAMQIQFVYASWLKDPSSIPPGVKRLLDNAGLDQSDYRHILATNPFASESRIDPDRFLPTRQSFPYIPPRRPNDPVPTQTYTETNTLTKTTTKTSQVEYSVGFSATAGISGIFSASLKTSTSLEWTNTSSSASSTSNTQQASLTVGGPSYGYEGATDVRVYWDAVFSSFVFLFAEGAASFSGVLNDSAGNPIAGEPVSLSAGGVEFRTFTDPSGGFRFYDVEPGECQVSARDRKFTVQVAPGQPAANLRL